MTSMLRKRKSSTNDSKHIGSSGLGYGDTMEAETPLSSLPIASQFMQASKLPSSVREHEEQVDHSHTIQRKPVPSETAGQSSNAVQHCSTVRIVPKHDPDPYSTGQGQRQRQDQDQSGSAIDHLTADVSQISLKNQRRGAKEQHEEHPWSAGEVKIGAGAQIPRSILDKTLPPPPRNAVGTADDGEQSGIDNSQPADPPRLQNLEQELGVEGQLDLGRTEDTDIRTDWRPAVIHEIIREDVHEIAEQRISRDIHQDHFFHRILPIEEVEVLPARHYVYDRNGALQDVSSQTSFSLINKHIQKGIKNGLEKALPTGNAAGGRRVFSARKFPDEVGDYREFVQPDGSIRSERWWVHPPTLESGGIGSGQTRPFHLGSADSEDDGWRS